MSAEELGRIFEPFARGATAGPAAPGAGLGPTHPQMPSFILKGISRISDNETPLAASG